MCAVNNTREGSAAGIISRRVSLSDRCATIDTAVFV